MTFAGDTNKYVAAGLSGTTLTLNAPGLRKAVADNVAITVGGAYTANLAFERGAVVGVLRPPIMPANPTIEQMLVSDDKGMTYLMLQIAQYGQLSWEMHLAWGFQAVNGEFSAIALG